MGIQYFFGEDASVGGYDLYGANGTGNNAAKKLVSINSGVYAPSTPSGFNSGAPDNPPPVNFPDGYLSLGSDFIFTAPVSYDNAVFSTGGDTVSLLDTSNSGPVAQTTSTTSTLISPLQVKPFIGSNGKPMVAFDANLNDRYSAPHYEVAVSDGTSAGTEVATSLTVADPKAHPLDFTSAGTFVLFTDIDAKGNFVAYATNGTTTNVLDPTPGSDSALVNPNIAPIAFVNAAGQNAVAFINNIGGADAQDNYDSYIDVSNGTGGAGTKQFLLTSYSSSNPKVAGESLVASGSNVFVAGDYFGNNAQGSGAAQLFSTDGSTEGVVTPAADGSSNPYDGAFGVTPFVNAAGQAEVAFIGDDTVEASTIPGYQDIYVTTGTLGRTAVEATHGIAVGVTVPNQGPTYLTYAPVVSGNTVYFVGRPNGGSDNQIYATNGGAAVRLDPNAASATPTILDAGSMTAYTNAAGVAGVAFFANTNLGGGSSYQLLTSNGQAGGTTVASGYSFIKAPTSEVISNGRVFFAGQVNGSLTQAFSSDGKTVTLLDTSPAGSPPSLNNAGNITAFTTSAGVNSVAFSANVGTAAKPNYQVFVSDGITTRNVTNGQFGSALPPGFFNLSNGQFVANGGEIYWSSVDASGNQQIYSSDGTTAVKVNPVGDPTHTFQLAAAVNVTGADVTVRNAVQPDAKSGTATYTFNVERSGDLTQAVTLSYTISGSGANPASAGLFTTPLTGTVSFAQGQSLSILSVGVKGQTLSSDAGFTVTVTGQDGFQAPPFYPDSNQTYQIGKATPVQGTPAYVFSTAFGTVQQNVTPQPTPSPNPTPSPTPSPTPTPTPAPVPTPTPSANPSVASFVSSILPASSYNAAGLALASAGLGAAAGSGTVSGVASASGSFGAAPAGATGVAVATAPAAGGTLTLPGGYAGLVAQGSGAVTLSDNGAAGAVLVGNGAGDTFNSSGRGADLVGGNGRNTFNVSGTATVSTGDGSSTVKLSGQAAATVFTGAGGSTVVLAGGSSTVQSNGQDTVFGGAGASTVHAAKGLVAVGGAGALTFIGGSATSLVFGGSGGVNYTAGSAYDIVVGIGGPLNATLGSGGGQLWGNGGGDVLRAGSGQSVLFGSNGDQLFSSGSAGNFLVAGAGNVTEDGSAASGPDVFFGGTGNDTIILGSGSDLVGTGTGTSTVQWGSGSSTVFAFGTSAVSASGSSGGGNVVMGGTVQLNIAQGGGAARSFALFNFVPGTDAISLQGYDSGAAGNALASQVNGSGQTVLTLADNTQIQLIGVTQADASFFK